MRGRALLLRLGRALRGPLLSVCALALVVLAFELVARVALPEWAPVHAERGFWHHHPLLGWAHQPGESGMHRHPDFAVDVSINSHGLRDDEIPLERTPGRRRMLLLGDSFAWGFGVEHEQIFSEIIEARHRDWEIVNAGVSGYGTDQQLLYLREDGARWQPDVVMLLLHPNDIEDNAASSRYGYRKPHFVAAEDGLVLENVPVPRKSLASRLRRFVYQQTYVLKRLYELPALLPTQAALAAPRPDAPDKWQERLSEVGLTLRLLDALHEEVRELGARFVVVGVPMKPPLWEPIRAHLDAQGVPARSLRPAFNGLGRSIKFAHDPHWNPRGHLVAADAVEAFLVEQGVL